MLYFLSSNMINTVSGSDSSDSDSFSSDPDDTTDAVATINPGNNRAKRGILWCGVDEDAGEGTSSTPKITWPPPRNFANWRQLRPVRFGNPLYGTKMQLYSRTNHHLAVYPDTTIRGTPDENDLHTYLELISAGHAGHVRIKGLLSNLYVAMDQKGRLYGEPDMMDEATVFIESFQSSYNTYLSRKFAHLGWYIGIKKNGKFKRGSKTKYGQKAIKFLPRRSRFE